MFQWKDADHKVHYYYREETGRIVGQTHNLAHTNIWLTKILNPDNTEMFLGQYITVEFAKKAIQEFWLKESRTLIDG